MNRLSLVFALALALAGCAPAASAPATPTTPAQMPGPSEAPILPSATPAAAGEDGAGPQVFLIDAGQSEVRYIIDEILRNAPKTVIGRSQGVQGEIRIDAGDPGAAALGVFRIQADSFRTDSSMRDNATRSFILESGAHPEIVFEPTAIEGLPAQAAVGEAYSLRVQGNLTIRGITRPVTFEAQVQATAPDRLEISARATILRGDFDLRIPSVPSVASVDEDVLLELDLVALRAGS